MIRTAEKIKVGHKIFVWGARKCVVTSIGKWRMHPTVKKMCTTFYFGDFPEMTAFEGEVFQVVRNTKNQ